MKIWLVDTGPLIAFLHPREREHGLVVARLGQFSGQLVTTSTVIAEAMYFASADRSGAALLAEFVAESSLRVLDFSAPVALREAAVRMAKYADTPTDFADATLVLLAEHLNIFEIATLDRRGFRVFRSREGRAFRLVLDELT